MFFQSSLSGLLAGVASKSGIYDQDRKPLTENIAQLPDSSLRAQVFVNMNRMKSSNDLDLLEAGCCINMHSESQTGSWNDSWIHPHIQIKSVRPVRLNVLKS